MSPRISKRQGIGVVFEKTDERCWIPHISLLAGTLLLSILTPVFQCGAEQSYAPSPDKPWAPPGLPGYEQALSRGAGGIQGGHLPVPVDSRKVYLLEELIDLAERCHPETRVAWEQARAAAERVGLARSAYFPFLVASAGAAYESVFLPFPSLQVDQRQVVRQLQQIQANPQAAVRQIEVKGITTPNVSITGGGTLGVDQQLAQAALSMKWLLLDFGERGAALAQAKDALMAANVGFNATHQQIVFEVVRTFYLLNMAREHIQVAQSSLTTARVASEAVKARRRQGLATEPDLLQAEQLAAQAEFDLETAQGNEKDAWIDLLYSIGLPPSTELHVAGLPREIFPDRLQSDVGNLTDHALSQRPDIVAKLAAVRAGEAAVRKIRAQYYPKVSVEGHVAESELETSAIGSPYFGGSQPTYGVGVNVDLPIFDGFARDKQLKAAQADLAAAEAELAYAKDTAAREVWKAYTDASTALRKQESSAKLVTAAQAAYESVMASYKEGRSTYPDLLNAERALTAARSSSEDTRAGILTSFAALALAVGDLARPTTGTSKPRPARILR